MTTARDIITDGLHLFGIIDDTEEAQPSDFEKGIPVLNSMLRSEYMDGAVQYLMRLQTATLPVAIVGEPYSFVIGPNGDIPVDAVALKSLWCNDLNSRVNRETRQAPMADVVRTTNPGIITRWHQRRQVDGSIIVNAWQPPRMATKVLIEYGARAAEITGPDSDVTVPPEGIHELTLLYGRRICSAYGRAFDATTPVGMDAVAVHDKWKQWARGQQWLRFVRA